MRLDAKRHKGHAKIPYSPSTLHPSPVQYDCVFSDLRYTVYGLRDRSVENACIVVIQAFAANLFAQYLHITSLFALYVFLSFSLCIILYPTLGYKVGCVQKATFLPAYVNALLWILGKGRQRWWMEQTQSYFKPCAVSLVPFFSLIYA